MKHERFFLFFLSAATQGFEGTLILKPWTERCNVERKSNLCHGFDPHCRGLMEQV